MKRRVIQFILFLFLGLLMVVGQGLIAPASLLGIPSPVPSEQEGHNLYQNRQYREAIERWQWLLHQYKTENHPIAQASILNDLGLAYRQIGDWTEAERAIAESLSLLDRVPKTPESLAVLARTWNNRGVIQLARGQTRDAFDSWRTAEGFYASISDKTGIFQSRINQAIALNGLGFYSRACQTLASALGLPEQFCHQPDTAQLTQKLQALPLSLDTRTFTAWRTFGETWESLGKPAISALIFRELLPRVGETELRAILYIALGNTARERRETAEALDWYGKVRQATNDPRLEVQADLARSSLYLDNRQNERALSLLTPIAQEIERLPLDGERIATEIHFASLLLRLEESGVLGKKPDRLAIARLLARTAESAQKIGAYRWQSLALGELAELYEREKQYPIARQLTEKALVIAITESAPELIYRWQWQIGRILAATGERQKAIDHYHDAIATLRSIEPDIVAADRGMRFSFREQVEPVYRQFVSLLLQPDEKGQIDPKTIEQARQTIESLRVAELNNFFREACLEARVRSVETIDPQAAIIYPIVLGDRLVIILGLPNQPLQYYSSPVSNQQLEKTVREFRFHLVVRPRRDFFEPGRQLYQWLIEPIEAELAAARVKTLVFVLDGPLRNIPMSALFDGKQYLIEKYQIALAPSSQLIAPEKLQQRGLSTLVAGLTNARDGFPPLYYVADELKTIRTNLGSTILLNELFTIEALENRLLSEPTSIVHIATHGQFSSNFEDTFILAWDGPIDVTRLDRLLKGREEIGENPIELLVLSACETATGDDRAALGLAGLAVRSGARSTIATLWPVNDEATSQFMNAFYQGLVTDKLSKAAALRKAQLTLLQNPEFRHPFYWSPYVLLGNWL
jgi:CHAT domain-containing protein